MPFEEYLDFAWRRSLKIISLQLSVALQEDGSYEDVVLDKSAFSCVVSFIHFKLSG